MVEGGFHVRVLSILLWVLAGMFASSSAAAHDPVLDQIALWPNAAEGELRGQILLDPALTRGDDVGVPGTAEEAQLLGFLERSVTLFADGRKLRPRYELREFWTPGGATPADSVMLRASLPEGARSLEVEVSASWKTVLVAVESDPRVTPGGSARSWLMVGGSKTPPLAIGAPTTPESARSETRPVSFLWGGFVHVIPEGLDHILFVVGLVLGARARPRWLLTATALFSLAHTMSFGLASLGVVSVPAAVVEPIIAASIALVGVENLVVGGPTSRTNLRRAALVVGFGLIHGLGFAGALAGLSVQVSILAILWFNLGVEGGQLVVVLAAYGVSSAWPATRERGRAIDRYGSWGLVGAGGVWTLVRLLGVEWGR